MSIAEMVGAGVGALVVVTIVFKIIRGGVAKDRGEDSHSSNSFWG